MSAPRRERIILAALIFFFSFAYIVKLESSLQAGRGYLGEFVGQDLQGGVRGSQDDPHEVCIVGADLSGAVLAQQFASQLGKSVLVVDHRPHVGGDCYDYVDEETGILVSKYGPRLFHTQNYRVWNYVQQFSEWTPHELKALANVGGKSVSLPLDIDAVNALFGPNITTLAEMEEWIEREKSQVDSPQNAEEMAWSRVGKRVYDLIYGPYISQRYHVSPSELDANMTTNMFNIDIRSSWDDRYFQDIFQALPLQGYTSMIQQMLTSPLIDVRTHTDYFRIKNTLQCRHTYFSGPMDDYFTHAGYPKLDYKSVDYDRQVLRGVGMDVLHLPAPIIDYPERNDTRGYNRIVEYKHFWNQTSPHTLLFYERWKDAGEPIYPVPTKRNIDLHARYQQLAANESNVTFVGGLAHYQHYSIDQTILNALQQFDSDAPKVAIWQLMSVDTGGPEALIQLAIAFYSWMPHRTYIIHKNMRSQHAASQWIDRGYPMVTELPIASESLLQPGDIYIIPESINCPQHLVQKGVLVYVWQLSHEDTRDNLSRGCKYVSHTFFTAHSKGLNLPRSHVLLPYLRRSKIHFGLIENNLREDIILMNKDHSESDISQTLETYCQKRSTPCQVIVLQGFTREELTKLYRKAKIVAANCLNGAERSVIEASSFGTLILTNHCDNGADIRDFPIPREHMYSSQHMDEVADIVEAMLNNFETEQKKLESLRKLYKGYGATSLMEDTVRFMHNYGI